MKSSQGTAATAAGSQPGGQNSRGRSSATQNDYNTGYRNQRDHHESVEHASHGQRSKSTQNHQAHHSTRDGAHSSAMATHDTTPAGQSTNSSSNARNAQPRSHSQAKGPSTSTRESGNPGRESGSHGTGNANAVGHYILGKALGEGTFGKVKQGTHVLTGEKVAVKVLEKSKIKDRKDVERISREIKILKQLHHPNVVQIYEIIETDKDLYLVMEFASGGELFELIVQNQKLKERTASKHLQELLAGVHYIHQLGICHRDLKPENLLLDFDGQLKIVDFGLSNMYEKGQTLKTACGSPCYAAPEMIAGNRYHGLRSDIWSCGVVLYAMLCGYLPFEDQKTSNLYKKIMNAEYSLPKFLSADAKDILSKIFVTDPSKRIDIEGLKQHPWYRLYSPENDNYNYHNIARTVNEKLVVKMEASLGFSIESVQRAVENNKHNHLSATYYLLLKKYATASYKSQQTQRCASVPARVDTRNPEYTNSRRAGGKQTATVAQNSNSDSKNRPSSSANEANSSAQTGKQGSTTSQTSSKYQSKFRGDKGSDRSKAAPAQEPLLVKNNHRREQSANATASRHTRNSDWVGEERRSDNYGRGGSSTQDNYEVVVSKNQHHKPLEEAKQGGQQREPANTTNMRQHFISPSPEMNAVASRHRTNSIANQAKNQSSNQPGNSLSNTGASGGSQKHQPSHGSTKQAVKPVEVNIQNIKTQYNQVQTPSQVQTRATSLPKQNPPKPATYTQPTATSNQRSVDKTRPVQKQTPANASTSQSHHRKTKSTVPDIQKQNSFQHQSRDPATDPSSLVDQSYLEKSKLSQTQKIGNLSKSSGQQPRQQTIQASGTGSSTAKVSDLIGNLNMITQQKTYFDKIKGKHTTSGDAPQTYIASKQQSAEQAAGIEGKGQQETIVNVNTNGNNANRDSSGIFQSLSNISQRPLIQDINSQNLLKRLESGNSDNQLRQNFASRQSQQQTAKRKEEHPHTGTSRAHSPTGNGNKRSTLQVEDPKVTANSRLSGVSYGQNYFLNQPVSKTPVTGYQTLDTCGDISSHELKIPVSSDTDRGVSKSIFYGTQRLSKEVQEYSNDNIIVSVKQDFTKTQSINSSYQRSNNNLNERSSKNVTQRADQSNRIGSSQPKMSQSTKHQRNPSTTINKKSEEPSLNSSAHMSHHLRQTHNGYSIPTQQAVIQAQNYSTAVQKNSQSKFQSLKVSSNPKVLANSQGGTNSSTIEHRTNNQSQMRSSFAQQQTLTSSSAGVQKAKEPAHKTRSQSVSGAQKSSNMYTPASHRKGNSSNTLLQSHISGNAEVSQTAHYRCSTASSQNKERRSSQPPHQSHHGGPQPQHNNLFSNTVQMVPSHTNKQRSTSSTNYQSSLLTKSIDAKQERSRHKSRRDPVNLNQTLQQASNDRQFQSITHTTGQNSSILVQQLEETIMNKSFTSYGGAGGSTTAGNSRYQPSSSSNYNSRKQQVASISQLLNVAETLRQSNYSVRPRQQNPAPTSTSQTIPKEPTVLKQNNYFSNTQQPTSAYKDQSQQQQQTQLKSSQQQRKPSAPSASHSRYSHPVVVSSDIKYANNQYQASTTQSELKASILGSSSASGNHGGFKQDRSKQHQSLTNAMKQITDSLMLKNGQMMQPSQVQQYPQAPSHQSYLSDLFQKQSGGSQGKSQSNSLFLTQNIGNQTQPIGLKSNLYSPTSQAKSSVPYQIDHLNQDLIPGYSQRAATYSKIDEQTHPQSVLFSQQLAQQHQHAFNQTQPLLGAHNNHSYSQQHPQQLQHQPQYYSNQLYSGSTGGKGSHEMTHPPQSLPISLLQQHQNTIQQLSGGGYTPSSGMPPQQLAVSIHSMQPQQQKPPSVPAPSTSYQPPSQYPQHQQHLSFYPVQGSHH